MDQSDTILVTGGTGFIGGRIVEALCRHGLRVRVASSNLQRCARVARFPVELVRADLNDHTSLINAVAGCTVVFHAGYRFGGSPRDERRINFDGTLVLAEAFLRGNGRRFVQISSIESYGDQAEIDVTEQTPAKPRGAYGRIKLDIEQALLELHRTRGLGVSILQPTIVYGPDGEFFTIRPLEELRQSQVALPAGGKCNAVYVDDVVSAALLAADRQAAIGEAFIISGPEPTTWSDFYGAYIRMLGRGAVLELNQTQMALEVRRQKQRTSLVRRLYDELAKRPAVRTRLLNLPPHRWVLAAGRILLPASTQAIVRSRFEALWNPAEQQDSLPLLILAESWREIYGSRYHARIDKARQMLGYSPAFNLHDGMTCTEEWARWANLLGSSPGG
jgi:nucleoside-diphosphate-sugar epimerase